MTFAVETPGATGPRSRDDRCLDIALVNNMPDAALVSTENQFSSLLEAGSRDHDVRLRRYTLPRVPREATAAARISENYFPMKSLWDSPPAAMIVTGSDPREAQITDEPYWADLVRLLEWGREHTASTIVSCLSAHALLLRSDGVARSRLPNKCSGVYQQDVRAGYPLTNGVPARIPIPHSRHNDVAVDDIVAHGYEPLITSSEVGWTLAQKQHGSCLLVMMQGHPEYEPITLLLEYRRDVRRYLLGERPAYPPVPAGYFSPAVEQVMVRFQDEALAATGSTADMVARFPFEEANRQLTWPWRAPSETLYANWLGELARRVHVSEVANAR